MWKEFKQFLARGNVLDLAVAVVIGTAFGALVQSLVNDILMPPIGMLTGPINFSDQFWVLREGANAPGPYLTLEAARAAGAVTMNYGQFFNSIVTFLIVTAAIFGLVKATNRLRPPAPTATRECPECASAIPKKARRCPACTSQVEPIAA